jgi:hypothetical protein
VFADVFKNLESKPGIRYDSAHPLHCQSLHSRRRIQVPGEEVEDHLDSLKTILKPPLNGGRDRCVKSFHMFASLYTEYKGKSHNKELKNKLAILPSYANIHSNKSNPSCCLGTFERAGCRLNSDPQPCMQQEFRM